jgi:hypothetical protein
MPALIVSLPLSNLSDDLSDGCRVALVEWRHRRGLTELVDSGLSRLAVCHKLATATRAPFEDRRNAMTDRIGTLSLPALVGLVMILLLPARPEAAQGAL